MLGTVSTQYLFKPCLSALKQIFSIQSSVSTTSAERMRFVKVNVNHSLWGGERERAGKKHSKCEPWPAGEWLRIPVQEFWIVLLRHWVDWTERILSKKG